MTRSPAADRSAPSSARGARRGAFRAARLAGFACALIAGAIASIAAPAQADTPFSWVAKVDEEIISGYDLDQRVKLLQFETRSSNEAALRTEARDQLIEEALKRRAAARSGVELKDGAVEEALNRIARGDSASYLNSLKGRGVERATVEKRVRAALLWNALLRREHLSRIEPSEAEIETELAAVKATPQETGPAVYSIARVFVANKGGDLRRTAQRAEQARRSIKSCRNIKSAGQEFGRTDTRGMTSQQLAGMGMPDTMVKELVSLSPGGALRPLRSPEGFHVFFNCGKRKQEAAAPSPESVKSALTNRKAEFVSQSLIADLRRDALIELAN
ncbi:MAG: peptidylprolyl isomerase [Pseudomonadota bacterium]